MFLLQNKEMTEKGIFSTETITLMFLNFCNNKHYLNIYKSDPKISGEKSVALIQCSTFTL